MKRFLVLFAVMMLCAGVANAQFIFEHNNEIGIYTTAFPTADNAQEMATYSGAPGQIFAYVVLTNPYNTNTNAPITSVGGFEFKLVLPANVFLLNAAMPPSSTNFATSPEFLAGTNAPVVDNRVTLLSLTLGEFSGTPSRIYLTPVVAAPQSVAGEMAITDFNDDFRISVAYPVSGDPALPVFGLWTPPAGEEGGVVPTSDAAWGDVKSLFR
jgi:hypothetical protein